MNKCVKCHGTGLQVLVLETHETVFVPTFQYRTDVCSWCMGTGSINGD